MAANITTQAETDVRAFARQFPTGNVLRMVEFCEAGRITWQQAYDLAVKSLASALVSA